VAEEVPAHQMATLGRAPNFRVQVIPAFRIVFLGLNRRLPELNDAKVRQALFWAIDRSAIIKTVLFGHGELPASSYMPRVLYSGTEPLAYDLAKARQLLSESAYPNGFSARLVVPPAPLSGDTAVLLKSQLDALGLRVQIVTREWAHYNATLERGDFEMNVTPFVSDSFDPVEPTLFNVVSTGFLATRYGYKNLEVDALALRAQAENDPIQRAALYRKLEQVVREDGPYVPLYLTPVRVAMREDVRDLNLLPNSDQFRLWEAWKSP
jgi:peptide/nickel transport system substrate-binding protein